MTIKPIDWRFVRKESSLHVEELDRENYSQAQSIVSIWRNVAQQRAEHSSNFREHFRDYSCEIDLLCAGLQSQNFSQSKILVSRDDHGTTRGMMRIYDPQDTSLKITSIVTHPMNFQFVMAIGDSLFDEAEKIARETKKTTMKVFSLASSVEFYKENDFVVEDDLTLEMVKKIETFEETIAPHFAEGAI